MYEDRRNRIYKPAMHQVTVWLLIAIAWVCPAAWADGLNAQVRNTGQQLTVSTPHYVLTIKKDRCRFGFETPVGRTIAPPHPRAGLSFLGHDAQSAKITRHDAHTIEMVVTNTAGKRADVLFYLSEHHVRLSVTPRTADQHTGPQHIVARTAGTSPAFGMADHGGLRRDKQSPTSTQLVPYVDPHVRASHEFGGRLISNFVIFPRQRFAMVNVEPGPKIVRLTDDECTQGSAHAETMTDLYYFFGEPKTIYREWLEVRNAVGYRVHVPKYEMFGVGWEAWGALEWNTSQETVTANIERYLDEGFPLSWMVIGSGFWPHEEKRLRATTSFGMWDNERYPDPKGMLERFHQQGLKVFIGLRIAFVIDGPFAADGVERGYFITADGKKPEVFKVGFPENPVHLLDTSNDEAVTWYVDLCGKWLDIGIDGFKEDLYGFGPCQLPDGSIDPVNRVLMDRGVYIMGRNGYLGSPMDLHRIEDFNFNGSQDRGPINGLCLAYAGLANVYPDVIGGAPHAGGLKQSLTTPRAKRYLMREAMYAAVNPAMALGLGPWQTDDAEVERVMLAAARLHATLQPTIYSAAVDAARTGFPYPMTPLPLAWPNDPNVYELANVTRRSYQWLIGESLLATPLYGDDYVTAETRDVYLPSGKWMDYDTGEVYQGPTTLHAFALPVDKTPLFIGGKGIVLERNLETDKFEAAIYPIAPNGAQKVFTCPNGSSQITIDVDHSSAKTVITDDDGAMVSHAIDPKIGTVRFAVTPGHRYRAAMAR